MGSPGGKAKAVKSTDQKKARNVHILPPPPHPGQPLPGPGPAAPRGETRGRCAAPRTGRGGKLPPADPLPPPGKTNEKSCACGFPSSKSADLGVSSLFWAKVGGGVFSGTAGAGRRLCLSPRGAAARQTRPGGAPVFNGKIAPKVRAEPGRAPPGPSGSAPGSEGPRRAGPVFLGSGALISAPAGASPGRAGVQPHGERVTDPGSGRDEGGGGQRVKIAPGRRPSGEPARRCLPRVPPEPGPAPRPLPARGCSHPVLEAGMQQTAAPSRPTRGSPAPRSAGAGTW